MASKGKYDRWLQPESLVKVQGWARGGLSDEQIAKNMGISKDTFYTWRNRFPEFSDAIKRGKEVVDFEVENALLKAALGYDYYESQYDIIDGEAVEVKRFKKHQPPNLGSIVFWLKNRKPQEWKDKREDETIDREINVNMGAADKYAD